ncbi:zinc knuckle CX2CX4HX4C containing protein [Tanacetum coccineum]
MVDSGKASGSNSIGKYNIESDNSDVHDHRNYGNGGTKPISFTSILKEQTRRSYFIRKRLAFPIVENYVINACAEYGIERVMLHNGFFFFQFSTKEGMEQVLENVPWLIRLLPIILNIWTPNTL